MERFQDMVTRT